MAERSFEVKIIEIRPCKIFNDSWVAFEAPGVEPGFGTADSRDDAIKYAKRRFGGSAGEIHVYDEEDKIIAFKIKIDGGRQDGQPPP
jgi:hypothetical protein